MDYNKAQCLAIGSVYYMKFEGDDNEQKGWRPGVVFQNNKANRYSPNLIALPCTTSLKKPYQPTHVILNSVDSGLMRDSMVLCENPQRMAKSKVGDYITQLPEKYIKQIAIASLLATSAISFISFDELAEAWRTAAVLNKRSGGLYV